VRALRLYECVGGQRRSREVRRQGAVIARVNEGRKGAARA
jgi:hypothetical protein